MVLGLTQNHDKTNHKGRKGHKGIRVSESYCVSPGSDEDDCFLVGFPDFPGQRWRTHGDTYELAVANGIEALESLIIAYEATGDSLPEPTVSRVR